MLYTTLNTSSREIHFNQYNKLCAYLRDPARRAARPACRRAAAPRPRPRTAAGRCAGCPSRPRGSRRLASPTARGTLYCRGDISLKRRAGKFCASRARATLSFYDPASNTLFKTCCDVTSVQIFGHVVLELLIDKRLLTRLALKTVICFKLSPRKDS